MKGKKRGNAGQREEQQHHDAGGTTYHRPQPKDKGGAGAVDRAFFKELGHGVVVDQKWWSLPAAKIGLHLLDHRRQKRGYQNCKTKRKYGLHLKPQFLNIRKKMAPPVFALGAFNSQ